MVPSGTPAPIGGSQSVPPSLLRSNSEVLGVQGGPFPSQPAFPSLVSPHSQFNNMNLVGNVPNVSSLLNHSFGNGGPNTVLPSPGNNQHGGANMGSESDALSSVGFNGPSSSSYMATNMVNPGSSSQVQGQQFSNSLVLGEQLQIQQINPHSFLHGQQQFSAAQNSQQQQFQSVRGGLAGVGPVKLEPQVTNDQHGQQQPQQQLQSLRNLGPVKLESQQLQTVRSLGPMKMDSQQHSDQSLFLHQQEQQQQQQQQHLLHMSQQPPHAAAAQILQQQRILQAQQQLLLMKAMPQQRPQLLQQFQQQQNLHLRPPMKPLYEPGTCARRLTQYICEERNRPEDNNIEFWRRFVAEYFAPNARKKWCVSMYGTGRQTTGVFPQDVWHCEICNRKPGRGFEATAEVLPRLFKIKYESGTLEELLYVDMPREYQNSSGQVVLDYAKAIQESVFEQLRVVRDGQLRVVFSPDLKICSWEFCARRHEELIPRRLLIPQVGQLGAAAQKYQQATQNAASNLSAQDLQNNCNVLFASARQLAKALEVPLVNDMGYTKRYVRCLQISEVVNSMKDLIDYSRATGSGPIESLAKLPRRTNASALLEGRGQQPNEQQQQQQQSMTQNSNIDQIAVQGASPMQVSSNNGVANTAAFNSASASTSASAISGLLHQNSLNGRQNSANNPNVPYGGKSAQMPSPSSSSTIPQTQGNPSLFHPPTPSSNNNNSNNNNNNHRQQSQTGLASVNHLSATRSPANMSAQQPAPSVEAEPMDSQSSVQKILHNIMMDNPRNGTGGMFGNGSLGNDVKIINGMLLGNSNTVLGSGSNLAGNGLVSRNLGMGGSGYGMAAGGEFSQSANMNGVRAANSVMNGRIGVTGMALDQSTSHQPQDLGSQLLNGLGAVDGFNNLQFNWKPSS